MPHPYPSPQLKPLFELSATLERFDDLGQTPLGHRMMAVVGQGSGTISGDRVRGKILQEAEETGCFCVPTMSLHAWKQS